MLVTANVQRQVAGLFVVEDRGAYDLRGVPQPVNLYRIVRAATGPRRNGLRTLTPLAGREEELALLTRRWERARSGKGQLALIVGEPGIGKSRLLKEFQTRLSETPHTWIEWSASQLLQNTPLHPIAEWGRQRFDIGEAPAERLAELEKVLKAIGLEAIAPLVAPLLDIPLPPSRVETGAPDDLRRRQLAAIKSWILAGSRVQPLVLAFEDLQWSDPTSLDLLSALAKSGAQAPLYVLATARNEFQAPWRPRAHHALIAIPPLNRANVRRMIGALAARDPALEAHRRHHQRTHRGRASLCRRSHPAASRARRTVGRRGDPADPSAIAVGAARQSGRPSAKLPRWAQCWGASFPTRCFATLRVCRTRHCRLRLRA